MCTGNVHNCPKCYSQKTPSIEKMSNDLHVIVSHERHVHVWQTVHLRTNQITVPQSSLVVTCVHSFHHAVLILKKKQETYM